MTAEKLLSPSEMREVDASAVASGISGLSLMEAAGAFVAQVAGGMCKPGGRIAIVAGPGQNGGDGFVAARLLVEKGYQVQFGVLTPVDQLKGDAAEMSGRWTGEVDAAATLDLNDADLIVDALFGAGLTRAVEGEAARLIERINAAGKPVLAVDLPSGVDGATGLASGAAIQATRTATFVTRKPGHLLFPGRGLCGSVEVGDIGARVPEHLRIKTFANSPPLWMDGFPKPGEAGHKYDRGHTLVVSGGAVRTGAARMAARAALRVGAGLVTLASPPEALGVNAAQVTAVMLRGFDGAEGLERILEDSRFNAVIMGPALGINSATRAMVHAAMKARRSLVLDADSLTSFEGMIADLQEAFRSSPAVLTPHTGEFKRLFDGRPEILDAASKLDRAKMAASYLGAVVLLKGADTVIAAPDGRAAINENGSPYLATAGSGDTLCGFIGGLMSQNMPPFEAACAGTWLHGECGRRFGPGLIAEDLPEVLPGVLRDLLS
jgi:NAD(P)H-hydrate epimerase